jgi:CRISPR-associated endoribonuclease Cas6
MRLQVTLELEREALLPMNHQHALSGLVYRLLEASDPEYSRFLHEEGYRLSEEKAKRFKLFTFSSLRIDRSRRTIEGDQLRVRPGRPITWLISSPLEDFLTHSATGLLTAGSTVCVGTVTLVIREVCALPTPTFTETMRFTCLTPIVASVPLKEAGVGIQDRNAGVGGRVSGVGSVSRKEGGTYYLRPSEGEAFSEAIRKNLLQKYRLLHGADPADDRIALTFDAAYLADPKHRGGTKKITVKGIEIIGALSPFALQGNSELMQVAWDCGLGEKNSTGFGMIALANERGLTE